MAPTSTSVHLSIMSHPCVHGPNPMSFEELRIEDYLKSYRANGRPPLPCPQIPTSDTERVIAGIPPLFRPIQASDLTVPVSEISDAQQFDPAEDSDETYQSISCMPGFRGYSPEELRVYAYIKGNKTSPTTIKMHPFTAAPDSKSLSSSTNKGLSGTDQLQSLVAQTEYERHSPEELRVAYMRVTRELTSAEIESTFGGPINAMRHINIPLPAATQAAILTTPNPFAPSQRQTSGLFPSSAPTAPSPSMHVPGLFGSAPTSVASAVQTFGLGGHAAAPPAPTLGGFGMGTPAATAAPSLGFGLGGPAAQPVAPGFSFSFSGGPRPGSAGTTSTMEAPPISAAATGGFAFKPGATIEPGIPGLNSSLLTGPAVPPPSQPTFTFGTGPAVTPVPPTSGGAFGIFSAPAQNASAQQPRFRFG